MWETLSQVVRAALHRLRRLAKAVAQIDALVALSEVAEAHRYTRPELCESPVLELEQNRHPVLERLMPGGERFVPNDLRLDAATRQLLIVTGPNMAGKSTAMRQAALCVIMAQMGGFVPAKRARIGLCDRIFTRVGAADDLGRGHSTFMVEMVETANILRHATPHSLVLLDEIGRGTSTFDGVSIAWAVAEYLHDVSGCRGMFATHYHELCALADSHPRIFNASVAIKQEGERLIFLRHLVDGGASRSFGLEVARLAAVPDVVLRRAASILEGLESERPQGQSVPSPEAAALTRAPPSTAAPAAGAPEPPPEPPADKSQLLLFCRPAQGTPPPPRRARQQRHLEQALAKYDLDRMTPLEAMAALAQLQQML
jgi:DNA mismatch repair protein MutS